MVSAHRLTLGLSSGPLSTGVSSGPSSCRIPRSGCTPSHSGSVSRRRGPRGPWRRARGPRFPWRPRIPRAQRIPRPLSWTRRYRDWPVILVGPVVVVLPALLRLPAAYRRGVTAGLRPAPVVLVLLSQHQSLLPDGSNVPRGVDQSPAAQTIEPRAPTRCRGLAVSNRSH